MALPACRAPSRLPLLLAALAMAAMALRSRGMRYPLPSTWSFRHSSAPSRAIPIPALHTVEGLLYPVFSDASSTFVLGFFTFSNHPHPASLYTLSLLMFTSSVAPRTAMVVWTANRNTPVLENATLAVTEFGDLALLDATGSLAWSAGLDPSTSASALEIVNGKGLIRLFDHDNRVIWRSWDSPSDTLLPSQALLPGMRLVASSSPFSQAEGQYSMVMGSSGIVLFISLPGSELQPYLTLQLRRGTRSAASAFRPCGTNTTAKATLHTSGIVVAPADSHARDPSCRPNTWRFEYLSTLRLCRLEFDGSIRAYFLDRGQWQAAPDFLHCASPLACGRYSICSEGSQCVCPPFTPAGTNPSDCSPPLPSACIGNGSSHRMVRLDGITYFSNPYSSPLPGISSQDDCSQACSSNCGCGAAFFESHAHACFHVSTVLSLLNTSSPVFTAFIKVAVPVDRLPPVVVGASAPSAASMKRRQVCPAIIIAVLALALALSLCLLVVLLFRRRWRRPGAVQSTRPGEEDYDRQSVGVDICVRYTFKELKAATNGFGVKLGEGGFGSVYKGTLAGSGQEVAVKRLESTNQGKKHFLAEVATLDKVYHVNLVRVVGFCSEASNQLLVYEYMPNGALNDWLFGREERDLLAWAVRFQIAVGAACGLAYLHERCDQKILHFDIKPENILLDSGFVAKVSDFGMSKLISRSRSRVMTMVRGTPAYMAPEWLLYFGVTEKSDVFSYGMVLLEIVSGHRIMAPCEGAEQDGVEECAAVGYLPMVVAQQLEEGRLTDVVDGRLGGDFDRQEASRVLRVALWCIQQEPSNRPSMGTVVKMLGGDAHVEDPPVDLQFLAQNYMRICALLRVL